MSSTGYIFRPEHYSWLVRMANVHNMGFQNKTLVETVDYALKHRKGSIEAKLKAMSRRRLEHTNWKRASNCRLPDHTARVVQRLAALHQVDFMDALSVIIGDACSRINRDHTLEDSIFESPRRSNCTSMLLRDFKTQKLTARARTS